MNSSDQDPTDKMNRYYNDRARARVIGQGRVAWNPITLEMEQWLVPGREPNRRLEFRPAPDGSIVLGIKS